MKLRPGFVAAALLATACSLLPARAAPTLEYGTSAYLALDAGSSHWFVNAGGAGVTDTGLITQAISDNARGGAQAASTSGYASIGALGAAGSALSSGSFVEGGQAGDDLSWYTDVLVTGTPGTRVAYTFATTLDGFVAVGGLPPPSGSAGSRVTATTFVAGNELANWDFSTLLSPGPFSELALATYEFDVGTVFRVGSRLTLFARAEYFATAEADALRASRFFVDVLTPGGGYVAGGGVVFPTLPGAAVPEPAALWLVAIALLVVAALSRPAMRRRAAAAALLSAGLCPLASAAPTYQYTTLQVPGAAETWAYGVDDGGRVVGAYRDAGGLWHGFSYAGATYSTIDAPGAAQTSAFRITNGGAIVGAVNPGAGPSTYADGYLNVAGTFTPIAFPGAVETGAFGVNESLTIVGSYRTEPPVGAGFGYHGFVWSAGTFTTIDIPNASGTFDDTSVWDINNLGQLVGEYGSFCSACPSRSFFWDAGAVTTFAPFGEAQSGALGLNDLGAIVGWYGDIVANDLHGYLYTGGELSIVEPPGSTSAQAADINNHGVIVGTYLDAGGVLRGFIAAPAAVPAPATAALVLAAGLWLLRRRRGGAGPTRRVA